VSCIACDDVGAAEAEEAAKRKEKREEESEEESELEEHLDETYVTLATNDVYAVGAMVLAYSLRATCTTRQLVVMVTPEVSQPMRELLTKFFDVIFDVTPIDSNDFDNLSLLNRHLLTSIHSPITTELNTIASYNITRHTNFLKRHMLDNFILVAL